MASEMLKKAAQTITVLGLVGVPAFGGQFASAAAKAKLVSLRNQAAGSRFVEFLVDLGGGVSIGLPVLGVAALVGSKGASLRALPFVCAGIVACGLLPLVDSGVDGWVRHLIGAGDDADAASTSTTPGGRRQRRPAKRTTTLRPIPGGARDNVYSRSKQLRVPGGGMTVEANQAQPVPLSRRLRVPPKRAS
jgi:hypothetical protein